MKTQFSVSAAICFSKHLVYLFNFKNKREADRRAEVHAQERSDLLNCTSGPGCSKQDYANLGLASTLNSYL